MRRLTIAAAFAAALLAPILHAQTPEPSPPAASAPCPSTANLDELVKAIDAAVSGPADKDRTCFRALFVPDARLIPLVHPADGSYAPRVLNVDGWIAAVAKRGSAVFYEHQVKVETQTWGHMAHLWSTYETRTTPDGEPQDRGINSIQAVFDGHQWKVIEILWQAENPAETVPQKYLP